MNSESQSVTGNPGAFPEARTGAGRPPATDDCPLCGGDGWKTILQDGVSRAVVCECRRGTPWRAPTGFESLGEIVSGSKAMQAMLTPKDKDIAAIIARRQGAAQAISIEEITRDPLFRGDDPAEEGSHSRAGGNPLKTLWQRSIKDSVRRLRRAGMKVGACRGSRDGKKPVGYYVISTPQELSATVRPLLRQAIDELKTIEALTGRGMYTRELEGQQKLFENSEL